MIKRDPERAHRRLTVSLTDMKDVLLCDLLNPKTAMSPVREANPRNDWKASDRTSIGDRLFCATSPSRIINTIKIGSARIRINADVLS